MYCIYCIKFAVSWKSRFMKTKVLEIIFTNLRHVRWIIRAASSRLSVFKFTVRFWVILCLIDKHILLKLSGRRKFSVTKRKFFLNSELKEAIFAVIYKNEVWAVFKRQRELRRWSKRQKLALMGKTHSVSKTLLHICCPKNIFDNKPLTLGTSRSKFGR